MEKQILPIVGYGSQILRDITLEAENNTESRKAMQALYDTINSMNTAVGLAAPQVNSNLSMFVMQLDRINTGMINPRILKRNGVQQSVESCLSIPGLSGSIIRSKVIDVEFYDGHFNKHNMTLDGFNAIVFQHEYDHLNGIMYTDRMSRHGLQEIVERLSEIEKGNVRTYYDMIFFGPAEPVKTSPVAVSPSVLSQGISNLLKGRV
jgi:peptide deformylase